MKSEIQLLFSAIFMMLCFTGNTQDSHRIVFYNLENLFDIYDDPVTRDEEFTPGADIPWTAERYELKMTNMAKVLQAVGEGDLPAIIGMCEVENRAVAEDLLSRNGLKEGNYILIHQDSPDERGIDVALAYREGVFRPTRYQAMPVSFVERPDDRTRDILYVSGVFKDAPNDTLHIFVNHWPSRWGGQLESEPGRLAAAAVLKKSVDSIFSSGPLARIIIMGDFNDEPYNKSIKDILGAGKDLEGNGPASLVNLMYPGFEREEGSYYYRDWDMIDQIIVSSALVTSEKGLALKGHEGKVFGPEWVMFRTSNGILRPNRTKGRDYYGGYSDHLPVYIDIIVE